MIESLNSILNQQFDFITSNPASKSHLTTFIDCLFKQSFHYSVPTTLNKLQETFENTIQHSTEETKEWTKQVKNFLRPVR